MRYHKGVVKNRRLKIICSCLAMMLILLFAIDLFIRPYIYKVCNYQCNVILTDLITKRVSSEISENNKYTYNSLVIMKTDSGGNIVSVQNNMNEINKLYVKLTNTINSDINNINSKDLYIPMGSLSGINLFYGRGPDVKFKLDPLSSVKARIASKFTSTGVNQSLHELVLEISSDVAAVLPGHTVNVTVKSDYILTSTVIVGKVPDSYTYITGDNRDEISKVNDYKK